MAIVRFNFYKINVERKEGNVEKLKVNNNVTVTDVKDYEISLGKATQKGLRFLFEFTSEYEPKAGIISMKGDVLYLAPNEEVDEVLADWKKNKKTKPEIITPVLNYILSKCNIKALILSQDVNLPSPIPMPRVQSNVGAPPQSAPASAKKK